MFHFTLTPGVDQVIRFVFRTFGIHATGFINRYASPVIGALVNTAVTVYNMPSAEFFEFGSTTITSPAFSASIFTSLTSLPFFSKAVFGAKIC